MLRGISRKRALTLVAAVVVVGAMVGGAYAYWSATGSGSGNAHTGTGASVTVVQTVSPTGLYPGGSVALSGDFNNPNAGSVFIGSVTASVSTFSTQADGTKPPCTQADFSITGTATVNAQIAAGNGVGSWSGLSLAMTDAATNQDNCQNITVPIAYATA
jgi:hypothetical protein